MRHTAVATEASLKLAPQLAKIEDENLSGYLSQGSCSSVRNEWQCLSAKDLASMMGNGE